MLILFVVSTSSHVLFPTNDDGVDGGVPMLCLLFSYTNRMLAKLMTFPNFALKCIAHLRTKIAKKL